MTRAELGVLFTKLTENTERCSHKDYFNGMALVYNDAALILCTDSMPYDLMLERARKREAFLDATIAGVISFNLRNYPEEFPTHGVKAGLKWFSGKRHATRAVIRILEMQCERDAESKEYTRQLVVHKYA